MLREPGEKFFNIEAGYGYINPSAVVFVAALHALKYHGGLKINELQKEDLQAPEKRFENMDKHFREIDTKNSVKYYFALFGSEAFECY